MPLGEGVPLERGRERGAPLILPIFGYLAQKWLQIWGTDMLLIITSTGLELLRSVNINDFE